MMVWSIIGMSIFRDMPMRDIVNKLDILLPGNRPFVAPSAVVQARQRLGTEAIKKIFYQTQQQWHQHTPQPDWCSVLMALFGEH
jgi:hypothetical protein